MGAEKEAHDNSGCTALMFASVGGHFECADLLLKAGADKDANANYGGTALIAASRFGHSVR